MTGYRGRFWVVEILTMNAELERRIGAGGHRGQDRRSRRANGMLSLFESGVQHVLSGETSVEELLRVVDVPMDERSAGRRGAARAIRRCRPSAARQVRTRNPDR